MMIYEDIVVTVIVPVYNCESYIERCIKSILEQTHKNLEIILVLDGNVDKSPEICKLYAGRDDRIRIIEQENFGVATARNRGLDFSTGKWIVFVDSDDWIEKRCIEVLLKKAEDDKCDIVISGFYIDKGAKIETGSFYKYNDYILLNNGKKDLLINCFISNEIGNWKFASAGVLWAKMYRNSFLKNNNLQFIRGLRRMEDAIFNMYAFWFSSLTVVTSEALYHYTINCNSLTKSYSADYLRNIIKCLIEIEKFIEKTNCNFLSEVVKEWTIILMIEMIQHQFVPKECKLSRISKIKEIRGIIENNKFPFSENIRQANSNYLSTKQNIARLLLKCRLYEIVYAYSELKYRIENLLYRS